MLVKYLPRCLDERIPVPVQKKIVHHERSGNRGNVMVFETDDGTRRQIDLDRAVSLMPARKRPMAWLKMLGLFVLLVAFCAGSVNIALAALVRSGPGHNILSILQLMMGLILIGYTTWSIKVTIERYLYGGLSFDKGYIYFQSDSERSLFADILDRERRK